MNCSVCLLVSADFRLAPAALLFGFDWRLFQRVYPYIGAAGKSYPCLEIFFLRPLAAHRIAGRGSAHGSMLKLFISSQSHFILTDAAVITQTTNWIKSVVIGCNFCPFAAKAVLKESIRYVVLREATLETALETMMEELRFLDRTEAIETTLLIFPGAFADFEAYLDLVELAENLASDQDYDGIYQIASFHPTYCFAGSDEKDPANYTNRSIYPMLHLLREDSITNALENFPDPEGIPARNIAFAQRKGLQNMQLLRAACLEI